MAERLNQMINFGASEVPVPNQDKLLWSDDEIDLNLCLSLGGVHAKPPMALVRCSSLAGDAAAAAEERPFLSLERSCSLPAEASEEDEAARLRRVAAKKRLAEKQSASLGRAISRVNTQNCRQIEGQEFLAATNDNVSFKPFLEQRHGVEPHMDCELEQNPVKKVRASCGKVLNNWADVINRMPSVTTTGDGPNGKRIEGFLYKYTKGQVSIVCVCHGSFLSPAEFIRHAGGKEVANPMRHINVCTALPS